MSLAALSPLHASPTLLAVAFSVVLVLSLLAVEEVEMRRVAPAEAAEG